MDHPVHVGRRKSLVLQIPISPAPFAKGESSGAIKSHDASLSRVFRMTYHNYRPGTSLPDLRGDMMQEINPEIKK